jgi:hypothetical protein
VKTWKANLQQHERSSVQVPSAICASSSERCPTQLCCMRDGEPRMTNVSVSAQSCCHPTRP